MDCIRCNHHNAAGGNCSGTSVVAPTATSETPSVPGLRKEQQTTEDNSHGMRSHISNPEMQRRQQRSAIVLDTGSRTTGQSNWMIGCAVVMTTSTKIKLRRLSMATASQERCPWQDRSNVKKNTAVAICSVNHRVPCNWNGREDNLIKRYIERKVGRSNME